MLLINERWLIEYEPKHLFLRPCLLLRHKKYTSTLFVLGMREQLQLLVNLVNVIFGHIFEKCAIFAIHLIFIAAKYCILNTQFGFKKHGWNRLVLENKTVPADKTSFRFVCMKKVHIRVAKNSAIIFTFVLYELLFITRYTIS